MYPTVSGMKPTFQQSGTPGAGAFSLPEGAGPDSDSLGAYYPADSTGGLTLPIQNAGTAAASVTFAFSLILWARTFCF